MTGTTTTAERSCGARGLCCKLMGVASIAKAPHEWCSQFRPGEGCSVYVDRPAECVSFSCQWLKWPHLGDEWRPDRAGFVVHLEGQGRRLSVEVEPSRPGSWRLEPYYGQLKAWAAQGAGRGLELYVWIGQKGVRILADKDVDLGVVRPDRALALTQAT